MGNSSRKEKRPVQVQDERGNTGTVLPTPPPDAEQAPQAQHKHGEAETPPPNAGILVCECSEDDGMKSTESQEFGPCASGSQESTPEQSLQNTPTTPYPITESDRPFSSLDITTNYTDNVDPVPSTSGNLQPSALVAGLGPSAKPSFPLPHPFSSGAQPPPSGHQPPSSGAQPPPSGPQPPPSGLQPLSSGAQPPPSGAQPPPSGAQPPSSGAQPPPSGPHLPSSVAQPPRSGNQNQSRQNDQNSKEDKLNPGDDLETLWENPYFGDELSQAMDFTYSSSSKISDCNHLIHEFQIPLEERVMMSCSKESPSEKMLDYIKSSKPLLQISGLRTALKDGKAYKALRPLKKAIEDKKCAEDDYVTDVLEKNLKLRTAIILQLDSTGHWKQVSNELKIPLEKSSLFERDSTSNPAETFFQLLWTQSPTKLKVSKLKTHLLDLGQNDLVLKMSDISGEEPLTILRSKPSLMYGVIQPKLNAPNSPLLMTLAEKFQSEGYLQGVNIEIFQTIESCISSTRMMMKYVLCSQEEEYKIQDLVDKLKKIGRFDCCEIVAKYVKDVDFEEIGEANDMANGENVNRAQTQNND